MIDLIVIIISMIVVYIAYLAYQIDKLGIAPHINIIGIDISAPARNPNVKNIYLNIENSGKGAANFPKYNLYLIKNAKLVWSSQWNKFEPQDSNIHATYISSESDSLSTFHNLPQNIIKTDYLFYTLQVRMKYKDARGIEWLSFAEFKYIHNDWIAIKESRVRRVTKSIQ